MRTYCQDKYFPILDEEPSVYLFMGQEYCKKCSLLVLVIASSKRGKVIWLLSVPGMGYPQIRDNRKLNQLQHQLKKEGEGRARQRELGEQRLRRDANALDVQRNQEVHRPTNAKFLLQTSIPFQLSQLQFQVLNQSSSEDFTTQSNSKGHSSSYEKLFTSLPECSRKAPPKDLRSPRNKHTIQPRNLRQSLRASSPGLPRPPPPFFGNTYDCINLLYFHCLIFCLGVYALEVLLIK